MYTDIAARQMSSSRNMPLCDVIMSVPVSRFQLLCLGETNLRICFVLLCFPTTTGWWIKIYIKLELEETSAHKSTKTNAGTVLCLMTMTFDLFIPKLECWQLSCQFPTWRSPFLCSFDRGNSMYEQIFKPPYNLARRYPPLFNRPLPNSVKV